MFYPLPGQLCAVLAGLESLACTWACSGSSVLLPPEASLLTSLTALLLAAPSMPVAPTEALAPPALRRLSLAAHNGDTPALPLGPGLSRLETLALLGWLPGTVPAALSGATRLRKLRLHLPATLPRGDFRRLANELPALERLAVACESVKQARNGWCSRLLDRRPSLALFLEPVAG